MRIMLVWLYNHFIIILLKVYYEFEFLKFFMNWLVYFWWIIYFNIKIRYFFKIKANWWIANGPPVNLMVPLNKLFFSFVYNFGIWNMCYKFASIFNKFFLINFVFEIPSSKKYNLIYLIILWYLYILIFLPGINLLNFSGVVSTKKSIISISRLQI